MISLMHLMSINHASFWYLTVYVWTKALVDGTDKALPGLIWDFLALLHLIESLMTAAKYDHGATYKQSENDLNNYSKVL
jgi:hypothetical protein